MRRTVKLLAAVLLLATTRAPAHARADDAKPAAKPLVTLTEKAATEVKAIVRKQGIKEYWLRVGTKKSDEPGRIDYVLDVSEDAPDPKADQVSTSHGVRLVVENKSAAHLKGTVIEFDDNEKGRGFIFLNPNDKK